MTLKSKMKFLNNWVSTLKANTWECDTRVEILEVVMLFEKSSVTRHTKINISCVFLNVYNTYIIVGGDLASNIYEPAHGI